MDNNSELTYTDITSFFKDTVDSIKNLCFKMLMFFIKQWKIVLPLLILGIVLGYYWDKKEKFEHEIIVTPNFDSADYLYGTIDLINNKIKSKDSLFFQGIGLKNSQSLIKIDIEPVIDIFKLSDGNADNLQLIKIMTEDISMDEIIKGDISKKSYLFHKIHLVTKRQLQKGEVIEPLLDYLNDSQYFLDIQKEYILNTKFRLSANDSTLSQLNGILNNLSQQSTEKSTDNLIYFNDNNKINDLFYIKEKLINDKGMLKRDLIKYEKIIHDINIVINKKYKSLFSPKIVLLPILLLLLFALSYAFIVSFKNFLSKSNQ